MVKLLGNPMMDASFLHISGSIIFLIFQSTETVSVKFDFQIWVFRNECVRAAQTQYYADGFLKYCKCSSLACVVNCRVTQMILSVLDAHNKVRILITRPTS